MKSSVGVGAVVATVTVSDDPAGIARSGGRLAEHLARDAQPEGPDAVPELHDSFDRYKASSGPTINHFHEKLLLLRDRMNTPAARRIADDIGTKQGHRPVVVCDNTLLGPIFQKPLQHGADISVYSLTKYVGGHSDLMMGSVAAREEHYRRLRTKAQAMGTVVSPDDAALALPLLDAMVPAATALAQTAANPKLRAGFFYINTHGGPGKTWYGTKVDGTTTSCSCVPVRCTTGSGSCSSTSDRCGRCGRPRRKRWHGCRASAAGWRERCWLMCAARG